MGVPSAAKALGKEGPLKASPAAAMGVPADQQRLLCPRADVRQRVVIRAPRIIQGLQLVEHSVGSRVWAYVVVTLARTGFATPTAFGGYLSQDWRNLC